MKTPQINPLTFRRQYIISPHETACPFLCRTVKLNENYILYAHQDIVLNECKNSEVRIVLLGDIFDFEPQHKGNIHILNELIDLDFNDITERIARYTGRYLLIYIRNKELKLLHDTTATRKIFYADIAGMIWFASQPNLLGKILNLKETLIYSKLEYYRSIDFIRLNGANVGDMTVFDEIRQVMPNHYFDVNLAKPVRYFPNRPIECLPLKETAIKCGQIIRGYMENIVARYNVMLPVTAGKDSRLLVAATKNVTDKVYYYINKGKGLTLRSKDIYIPRSLLSRLGIDFHILDPYISIDEEFKRIYFDNNPTATTKYLPGIYNYYHNYSSEVNLPGNIAFDPFFINRNYHKEITPTSMSELCFVKKYEFAKEYYAAYFAENKDICERNNINILNLLYWEQRIGNWGTQLQLDKDIAQEEFNPYNSRLLTCLFLSVDYRLLSAPGYSFHKEVIGYLWPELLQEPINPAVKHHIKRILKLSGLFTIYCRLKCFINRL